MLELTVDSFWNDDAFSDYVSRVREEMVQKRTKFPFWCTLKDSAMLPGGGEIWYGNPPYYVKFIGASGTLAGDILRLKSDLPRYDCDLEIIEDDIHETERKLMVYEDVDSNLEDCSDEVSKLHSTPKSILLSVRYTYKKYTTCSSARVLPTLYSCWEGRKKGFLFFPNSSEPLC